MGTHVGAICSCCRRADVHKKDVEHDGGDILYRERTEREREEGAVERGGCVSKISNVENMECSEAALRLQYSI